MQMRQLLHKLQTRRNKDVFLFILFFIFAALLWYGHAMQSVRNTRVPVYIEYIGRPGSIGLGEEGLPEQVLIEVRDAGYRLNSYHQNPLQITIDLHQYIHGDSGTIQIPSNDLRASIKAVLQDNSKLIDTKPEEIRCRYFKEREKSVVLVFHGKIDPAEGYQKIGEPRLAEKRIRLYGSAAQLRRIDTVRTQFVELTNVSDSVRMRVPLAIPQGLRAEQDSVQIELPVEQYTEKRFTVPIRIQNQPLWCRMRLFPENVEVSIRIGMNHFDEIKASDLKVYCLFPSRQSSKLDVYFEYPDNPHITSTWYYPTEVEYLLEQ